VIDIVSEGRLPGSGRLYIADNGVIDRIDISTSRFRYRLVPSSRFPSYVSVRLDMLHSPSACVINAFSSSLSTPGN
jgi:hypothetical protein